MKPSEPAHWELATLIGADGHDLLQRISTLDLGRIPLGNPQRGLILNPQGKIRTSFFITRQSEDQSTLLFAPEFRSILDQFTFAERYELRSLGGSDEKPSNEYQRILRLEPKWNHEFFHNETSSPLEVNLGSAVHDQKGCYPGQEVIEKIIALGSPPKKLALFSFMGPHSPDAAHLPWELWDATKSPAENSNPVGTLTSAAQKDGQWRALGIIRKTHWALGTELRDPSGARWKVEKLS